MKLKTASLSGAALDWAVMSAIYPGIDTGSFWFDFVKANPHSTRWDLSGPIIENEGISIAPYELHWWIARDNTNTISKTPLIAAMRCYCLSKLGDEVEIPKELMKGNE